jgi:NitT/TauT family transport system substrate-binding protein
MKSLKLRIRAWIFVSLIVISSGSAAATAETRKITFGYSAIGPMMHGLWMAKEIGAFEKYGIEADLIYISAGPVVVQALIGGDLHAGLAASNSVISAVLNGAPIVGVAGMANRPSHRLWVQPEINRLEDLRGKTLGITRFGAVPHHLSVIVLRKYGLEGAVAMRQFGGANEVGVAFQQHAIAGAVTSDLRVAPNVPYKLLVNIVDLGIAYSMNMIAVQRDFYRRSSKTVDGLVRGYTEGVAALNRDKNRALKVITKYTRATDPKFLEGQYADSTTYLERIPRVEQAAVSTILEFTDKKGVPLETFADNSIVDRLVAEGFIDKLYKKN